MRLDIELSTIIRKIQNECSLDPISFAGGLSGYLIKTGIHLAAFRGCPNQVLRTEVNKIIKENYARCK